MIDAGDEEEWEEAVLARTPTTHDDDATKSGAKSAAALMVDKLKRGSENSEPLFNLIPATTYFPT
jgi:hypothetical protein